MILEDLITEKHKSDPRAKIYLIDDQYKKILAPTVVYFNYLKIYGFRPIFARWYNRDDPEPDPETYVKEPKTKKNIVKVEVVNKVEELDKILEGDDMEKTRRVWVRAIMNGR